METLLKESFVTEFITFLAASGFYRCSSHGQGIEDTHRKAQGKTEQITQ
jgi:hypothetical protein